LRTSGRIGSVVLVLLGDGRNEDRKKVGHSTPKGTEMFGKVIVSGLMVVAMVCCAVVAQAITIDLVPVGDPGNAGEWSGESYGGYGPNRICGAVDYTYSIGKYEVTALQYTEFLNAVAKTDTYGLYNAGMWSPNGCKIQQSGESGSYRYSVASDYANRPVTYVTYWDSCRFVNWLQNGQPTGEQGAGTTETGTYTLDGYNRMDGRTIGRNAGATWAVTNEDEWYKAAYYKGSSTNAGYWDYPTSSDAVPSHELGTPTDPGNNATFCDKVYTIGDPYNRTEVGAHENSDSPYGTFDQGGNVWEWNEAVVTIDESCLSRGLRGGSFNYYADDLLASSRYCGYQIIEGPTIGFRVVSVPEPGSLIMTAMIAATALLRYRRKHA
jgi:formylglycine-generating enzyme